MQDLVFVNYNQALKARYDLRDTIDPIALNFIDDSNEWLLGEMDNENADDDLVFDDDNLTWGDVARAAGVSEPRTYTRNRARISCDQTPSSSRPMATLLEDEEEEEMEGYKSSNEEEDIDLDAEEDETPNEF